MTNSTVSGNSASTASGGGIFNAGALTVTNSTISGNAASGQYGTYASGGGIYNNGGSPLTITNSTISGNRPARSAARAAASITAAHWHERP